MRLILFALLITGALVSCESTKQPSDDQKTETVLDIQGHRGARGLMPENTIPAFLKALEYDKVTTLELDLAVTKDKRLVVSHEPWFNHVICFDAAGDTIREDELISIYTLTYDEVKQFDCGSKGNPRFPQQELLNVGKPLLKQVIDTVNQYISESNLPAPAYNIEIKTDPRLDSIYTPIPSEFADLVVAFVEKHLSDRQVTIQSFDFRVLQYIHRTYPEIQLVALVENGKGVADNLAELGFVPEVYSPWYKLLVKQSIDSIHKENMLIVPWTVNDTIAMRQLIDWGVDGIITDYPNLAQKL